MRIIAAVGVLLFHARIATRLDPGVLAAPWLSLDQGVMVFFTLSGYLVTRPFLDGSITPLDHLTRRMVRLVPAYVVAVVGWIVVFGAMDLRLKGVAWTLLLEVMFYAAMPFLVALTATVAGGRHARQVVALVAIGGLSLAARYALLGGGETWATTEPIGPLWLWAFVPGMLVACAHAWYPTIMAQVGGRLGLGLGGALILSVLVVPSDSVGPMTITRMALVAVGTALLIPGLLRVGLPVPGRRRLASAGRTLSYPVYLWHPLVIFGLAAAGIGGWVGHRDDHRGDLRDRGMLVAADRTADPCVPSPTPDTRDRARRVVGALRRLRGAGPFDALSSAAVSSRAAYPAR